VNRGRPHRSAFHTASLEGGPCWAIRCIETGGGARDDGPPGEGGTTLRATACVLLTAGGEERALEAPLAAALCFSSGKFVSARGRKRGVVELRVKGWILAVGRCRHDASSAQV